MGKRKGGKAESSQRSQLKNRKNYGAIRRTGVGKQTPLSWKKKKLGKPKVKKNENEEIKLEVVEVDVNSSNKTFQLDTERCNGAIPNVSKYGFFNNQRILLVGEGDFSFSLALTQVLKCENNLIATSFDSQETLLKKYPQSEAIIEKLRELNVVVKFGVDARQLVESLHTGKRKRKAGEVDVLGKPFDRIVFNFPHVGLGIKDESINIQKNKELILGFIMSATPLLSKKGEIVITLKTGMPYQKWNVTGVAHQTGLLRLGKTKPFDPLDFPGYKHRRTLGFIDGLSADENEEILGHSKMYIFQQNG